MINTLTSIVLPLLAGYVAAWMMSKSGINREYRVMRFLSRNICPREGQAWTKITGEPLPNDQNVFFVNKIDLARQVIETSGIKGGITDVSLTAWHRFVTRNGLILTQSKDSQSFFLWLADKFFADGHLELNWRWK